MHADIQPPQWPLRFLRLFLKKDYLEEIEGDMQEVFNDNAGRYALRRARWLYIVEMLKLIRPILMKNFAGIQVHSQQAMFLNYFKISFRGLMRNPLTSFINVFGLAAAIGVCIFGYAFTRWTLSTDQFHLHKDKVYLVTFMADRDGASQQYGTTPAPLGEMLKHDVPQISKICRVEDKNVIIKHGPDVFHERIRYTDPEFLEMLTFPMKWGAASSLKDLSSIIISESMAVKYFGETNPMGSTLLIKFDKDHSQEFKVTGVAAEFPKARTISFDFLVNIDNLRSKGYDFEDWTFFVNATMIQVENPGDMVLVTRAMEKYRKLQNEASSDEWAISSFSFEPLATLHQKSGGIRDDISRGSDANYTTIYYLLGISLALLALACFNYINIAIVTAAKRLKEIGVRKSIGANRKTIIVQFLAENMVVTLFAMTIGLIIGGLFFIPVFEQMFSFNMDFRLSDPTLWVFLPAILLFTTVASGIYPSLYISKFQVAGILKGSVKFGQRNPITKIFLGVQLIVSCIFITGAILFTQNTLYLGQRPWGYQQSGVVYAVTDDRSSFDQLSALMEREPDVLSMAGSTHHLGKGHAPTILHFPNREYEVEQLSVDARYFQTMGLELTAGRLFNEQEGSDGHTVLVNEYLVNNLAWGQPIGQLFRIDSIQYEVIGVVKDFHSYHFGREINPTIFKVADKDAYRYLTLKVREGTDIATFKTLQDKWAELFPEIPFNGGLQEDVWGFYFEEIKIHSRVWRVLAFIAITLACLGLYGLISLNVEARVREFSIRKVLGAGVRHISLNIFGRYAILFAVALAIGAPLGHTLMSLVITSAYVYHVPITFTAVVFATFMLIAVLVTTVLTQVRRVVKANPVEGLKVE